MSLDCFVSQKRQKWQTLFSDKQLKRMIRHGKLKPGDQLYFRVDGKYQPWVVIGCNIDTPTRAPSITIQLQNLVMSSAQFDCYGISQPWCCSSLHEYVKRIVPFRCLDLAIIAGKIAKDGKEELFFLPSEEEINEVYPYFTQGFGRITKYLENGRPMPWWTRTTETGAKFAVIGAITGSLHLLDKASEAYIAPACVITGD